MGDGGVSVCGSDGLFPLISGGAFPDGCIGRGGLRHGGSKGCAVAVRAEMGKELKFFEAAEKCCKRNKRRVQ